MSFTRPDGTASWGVVDGDDVVDCSDTAPTLRAALAAGTLPTTPPRRRPVQTVGHHLLPPIPDPDKIICIGLNYLTHIQEGGRDVPKKPTIFTRWANTQVAHEQPLVRPSQSETLDFEGEMAVIIGRHARHISSADALSVVAGYSCYNDGSVREWQRHTSQFTPGKNSRAPAGSAPGSSHPTKPATSARPPC